MHGYYNNSTTYNTINFYLTFKHFKIPNSFMLSIQTLRNKFFWDIDMNKLGALKTL